MTDEPDTQHDRLARFVGGAYGLRVRAITPVERGALNAGFRVDAGAAATTSSATTAACIGLSRCGAR